MEDCWERLGIDATADTTAIKKAYAKQLKFNKPDTNPEGFRDLRAAYERALDESYWYEADGDKDEVEANDFAEPEPLAEAHLVKGAALAELGVDSEVLADDSVLWLFDKDDELQVSPEPYSHDNAATDNENSADEADYSEKADEEESAWEEQSPTVSLSLFVPTQWAVAWQQIAEDNELDISSRDQRLQALLQSQIDQPRSLDEQNDFEEALLVWLAEQPPVFALSYQLAKSHFGWDQRLAHWSRNDYPWYMLESLDQRYQHLTYFQTPTAFREFLTRHFPTVASYWPIEDLNAIASQPEELPINNDMEPIKLKRSQVFRQLFFPFRVTELAQELTTLDAELDYYIHDHPAGEALALIDMHKSGLSARYWQHDSPLTELKGWILRRFIYPQDFIVIAVVVAVAIGILSLFSEQPWQSFYNDGWGVFAALSLYYLFWQAQLRLFAMPYGLVSHEPWHTGWRNASIALFIMGYISWLDISNLDPLAMPTSAVYYLTHIAGASLLTAITTRQHNKVVTAISWYAGLLLLVLTVLIPLLVLQVGEPPYTNLQTLPISPLFWLLLAAPAWFIGLGENYPRLEWLANIGHQLIKVLPYLMLVGGFILFTYCGDILPKMNFGFTALSILLIAIIMALSMVVILEPFSEE